MEYSKIKFDLNLQRVNGSDFFELEIFESIKYKVYNLIDYLEWDESLIYANLLGQKLSEVKPLNPIEQHMHKVLSFWAMRLMLFVFVNLKPAEKSELLRNHTFYLISLGLDVKRALIDYLDFFDDLDIVKAEAAILLSDVVKNQEYIGNLQKFDKLDFKPVLANWLEQYQILLSSMHIKGDPGTFHVLKFIDNNQYVKFLNASEKENLTCILDLYNWLLSPLIYTEAQQSLKTSIYTNKQSFQISSGDNVTLNKQSNSKQTQTKKIDLNEILNTGRGIRLGEPGGQIPNSKLQISNEGQEAGRSETAKPVQAAQKVQSGISENEQHAKELLDKLKIVKKAPEVPVKKQESLISNPLSLTNTLTRPAGTLSQRERWEDQEDLQQIRSDIEKKKALAQKKIDEELDKLKKRQKGE